MEKVYERLNWENFPSEKTPLNENNLNKVDSALYEVDNRILGLDTAKVDKSTVNTMVKDVSFDELTGIFTITLLDGTTKTIDTKLEKIATNFRYDYELQKLILTLVDGSEQEVDLSSLISQYEFADGDIISFTVDSDGKVSAIVKNGSITEDKLQPNFLADVKTEVAKAKSSSDSAYDNATIASNSAQEAKTYRDEAKQYRDEVVAVTDVEIATKDKAGLVKGGENTIAEDGTLLLTRTTTSRTLTESHAGGLKINSIDGESQQKQYSGISLLNVTNSTITAGTNNYAFKSIDVSSVLKPNTKYIIRFETDYTSGITVGATNKSLGAIGMNVIANRNGATSWCVFTTPEDLTNWYYIIIYAGLGGSTAGNTVKVSKVMLAETDVDTLTDYEPYVGGIASPNPDYPQDIKSVEVSEIWSVGKNLYNEASLNNGFVNNGITATKNSKGQLNFSGTTTATVNAVMQPFTLPAGTYYMTVNGETKVTPRLYNRTSATFLTWRNGKFTLTEEAKLDIRILIENGVTVSGTVQIQIEEGDAATDYEPYHEKSIQLSNPIILRGIGDVKDVLCKRDGVFGVLRRFPEYIFSGTETLSLQSAGYVVLDASHLPYPSAKTNRIYCTHFRNVSGSELATCDYGVYLGNSINIRNKDFSTVDEYKNLFSNNDVKCVYESTPTFEPLPTADQILLYQLETFDTVTYISTDSEIEPIMEVEYGTSKVGAYTIKGINTADANALKIEQLTTLTNDIATQLVAGSEV